MGLGRNRLGPPRLFGTPRLTRRARLGEKLEGHQGPRPPSQPRPAGQGPPGGIRQVSRGRAGRGDTRRGRPLRAGQQPGGRLRGRARSGFGHPARGGHPLDAVEDVPRAPPGSAPPVRSARRFGAERPQDLPPPVGKVHLRQREAVQDHYTVCEMAYSLSAIEVISLTRSARQVCHVSLYL